MESSSDDSPEQHLTEDDLEKRPLLPGSDSSVETGEGGSVQWRRWRRWVVLCVLWLAQVVMTSAYSLVAPFFPLEV